MAIRSRDNEEDERSRDTTCDVGAVGDCRASDRREMGIFEFLDSTIRTLLFRICFDLLRSFIIRFIYLYV